MLARPPAVRRASARLAGLVSGGAPPDAIEQARAELATAQADRLIDALVKRSPPLTDEQRAKLRPLLAPRAEVASG
jgi:hypothetical protein